MLDRYASPSHRFICHRCEQPLRVVRPAHRLGDCAGRSPGLRVVTYRPAFPVSQWPMRTKARRSQLRGQPRLRHECRSVFPLASPVRPGEPARYEHFAIERERQGSVTHSAVRECAISGAVASELQNIARGLGIVDRRAGLGGPHAGCRDPSRLRILTATRYRDCQYKPGVGTDLEARESADSAGALVSITSHSGAAPLHAIGVALLLHCVRAEASSLPPAQASPNRDRGKRDAIGEASPYPLNLSSGAGGP